MFHKININTTRKKAESFILKMTMQGFQVVEDTTVSKNSNWHYFYFKWQGKTSPDYEILTPRRGSGLRECIISIRPNAPIGSRGSDAYAPTTNSNR